VSIVSLVLKGISLVATDFTLPELGENISAGDVLRVLVKPGDTIAKEQSVLELETDKATIEVPSSVAGKVSEVKVKAGDKVQVGQAILSVEDGGASAARPAEATKTTADGESGKQAAEKSEPAKADGDGGKPAEKSAPAKAEGGGKAESRPPQQPPSQKIPDVQPDIQAKDQSTKPDKAGVKDQSIGPQAQSGGDDVPARGKNVVDISRGARAAEPAAAPSTSAEFPPAPAAPSVRRMARELGVDINQVSGSGDGGRISVEDVKAHAKRLVAGAARGGGAPAEPLPDFSRFGQVERQPMRAVRRKTAEQIGRASCRERV